MSQFPPNIVPTAPVAPTDYQPNSIRQPASRRPRSRWAIPALLGALLLAAILALVAWRMAAASADSTQYHRPRPPVSLPALYYDTAKAQIALGFHLTVAQVAAEIRAHPGQGIFGVAENQGITPDQLHALELGALQAAGARMVATGQWTSHQADATLGYWQSRDAKSLGADITTWFQTQ